MSNKRIFFYFGFFFYVLILIAWLVFFAVSLDRIDEWLHRLPVQVLLIISGCILLLIIFIFAFKFHWFQEITVASTFDLDALKAILKAKREIMLIFNNRKDIVWSNQPNFFLNHFNINHIQGVNLKKILPPVMMNDLEKDKLFFQTPFIYKFKNEIRQFLVSRIKDNILIFYDNHVLYQFKKYVQDRRTLPFLLQIDTQYNDLNNPNNKFEEQKMQILAFIDLLINKFFNDKNILVISTRKGEYLIFINIDILKKMKARKFIFLEQWQKQIFQQFNLKVTFSGGIYEGFYEFVKTENPLLFNSLDFHNHYQKASYALKIATTRGGDQVIVSQNTTNFEIFGKQQQKNNLFFNLKDFYQKFISQAKKFDNFIIVGHKQADFDVYGAAVGIYTLLMNYFAVPKVTIIIKNPELQTESVVKDFLPKDINLKNNWHFFSKYSPEEKSKTLLILVDTNQPKIVDIAVKKLIEFKDRLAIIDHHLDNFAFDRLVFKLVSSKFSSASEIVANFLFLLEEEQFNFTLEPNVAKLLLMGILMDTNNLNNNVKNYTLPTINLLTKKDVKLSETMQKITVLKMKKTVKFENLNVINIDKNIFILKVLSTTINHIDAALLADDYLTKQDVQVVFVALHKNTKEAFISARSRSDFNVETICKEFSGGGDRNRAAAHPKIKIDDLILKLKLLIQEQINN